MKLLALAVIAAIFTAGAVYHMAGQKNIPTPVYDSWMHWKQKWGRSYGTNTEESPEWASTLITLMPLKPTTTLASPGSCSRKVR